METKKTVSRKKQKIIPLKIDATFFFERAVRSLDRCHYDKALKYFRKAVEYEPDNAVNHCNLAGVLSEMGNYGDSNDILRRILDKVEPKMTECHFYMANNYANMEDYESAERSILKYLEEDPDGDYLEEAEELIDLLSYELRRPSKVTFIKSREDFYEHDRARELLEEGSFLEASRLLEKIVRKNPDFLAARNNLALTRYYLGHFEKAMEELDRVLAADPGNIHALCNEAIFFQHVGDYESLADVLGILRKLNPFHAEHLFKIATTMGILGDHESAYRQFKRLLSLGDDGYEASLYHYAAVAAFNTGRFAEARKRWKQAERIDPKPEVARFYLNLLEQGLTDNLFLNYHYQLPFEEQLRNKNGMVPESIKWDTLVRQSFLWALRHGDVHAKLQVLQAFAAAPDVEAEAALRDILLAPAENEYLKRVALFILRSMNAEGPVQVCWGDRHETYPTAPYDPALEQGEEEWQAVLALALTRMRKRYDLIQQFDLETLWVAFLTRLHPEKPNIGKIEGWSAALEYLTAKMHRKSVSYEEIAERYGVSPATVSRNAKRIDETCGLKEKLATVFGGGLPFNK